MRSLKKAALSAFIAFSMITPSISLAVDFTQAEKDRVLGFVAAQSSWIRKAAWLIVPVLVQVTLSEVLVTFFSHKKTEEEKERDKIESLMAISHAMKNQIDFIRPMCKEKQILQNIQHKYVSSFSKVLNLHDEHLEKYAKKKQFPINPKDDA